MDSENNPRDIRWKQRFNNFKKALHRMEEGLNKTNPSDLEKAGIIKIYELSFELGWKTLKDYLESKAVKVKYPRDVVKESFKYEIIDDGDLWIEMLEKRNYMVHTYSEESAELAYKLIKDKFYPALEQVYKKLGEEV